MAHHEPCGPNEVFVGNTNRESGSLKYLSGRMKTARLGNLAFCLEGKPLPLEFAPLFIGRAEEQLYDSIMMNRTFGPNWRRY